VLANGPSQSFAILLEVLKLRAFAETVSHTHADASLQFQVVPAPGARSRSAHDSNLVSEN
jgi:hypothetical protein